MVAPLNFLSVPLNLPTLSLKSKVRQPCFELYLHDTLSGDADSFGAARGHGRIDNVPYVRRVRTVHLSCH